MKLSRNFTLAEMVKSNTAKRLGISNVPTEKNMESLRYLTTLGIQKFRDRFGPIRVSSGFRSVKLCEAVGSSRRSFHAQGQAADIECMSEGTSNLELVLWAYDNLEFTELIAEYFDRDDEKGGWVHYALAEGREQENVLKLKDGEHDYEIVSIEYLKNLYGVVDDKVRT